MYKNHQDYKNMIRLVGIYHKDLLAETHLFLARTLEADRNLKEAEIHFVEAGDAKTAVNMYCSNSLYEDAYRLAKAHEGPTTAKQVAYLWARSIGGEAAVKLLTRLNLLDSAIEFATDSANFDFAFELSRFAGKHKLEEVHFKHAMYLEDEGKFEAAERAFILAGKPREAILMYIHEENWIAALSVAENADPTCVPDVLIGQAKSLFSKAEYSKAESLILRAQRPELGIQLYKESNNWKEAIQFAKHYLPNKLAEINQEYDRYLAEQSDSGKDHLIQTAQRFEHQGDYNKAIELYLKLSISHTENYDLLEEKWKRAAELAIKFIPDRTEDVFNTVSSKLLEIRKFAQAGELLTGIESYKKAIDAFIAGGLWEKARKVIAYAPKYSDYIENAYVKHLKSSGRAEALVDLDVNAGLEVYAQQGDWEKCLETAAAGSVRSFLIKSPEILGKYLGSYCTLLITQGNIKKAVEVAATYGAPPVQSNWDIYSRITAAVLSSPESNDSDFLNLRNMLYQLVIQY
jgi:intraflagellar transport protein 172